jgi:hypothetical protein
MYAAQRLVFSSGESICSVYVLSECVVVYPLLCLQFVCLFVTNEEFNCVVVEGVGGVKYLVLIQ